MLRVLNSLAVARRSVGASAARRARGAERRRPDAADRRSPPTGACAAASTPTSSRRPARSSPSTPAAQVALGLVGRKGRDFFARRGFDVRYEQVESVRRRSKFDDAQAIAAAGDRGVHRRRGRQRVPRLQRVQVGDAAARRGRAAAADPARSTSTADGRRRRPPSRIDYLLRAGAGGRSSTQLLPRHVEVQVFRALLESNAAFYAAQMTAMDAATRTRGDDRQPDALHEQGPPGGDHARDYRSGVGRAGAVTDASRRRASASQSASSTAGS